MKDGGLTDGISGSSSGPQAPRLAGGGRGPWWRGGRGEWFVVAQILLMALVFVGPRSVDGRPEWGVPFPQACAWIGVLLMAAGAALLLAALFRLGRGLTPLPYPRDGSRLVQSGPYALVRHPMYSGGLVLGLGWALRAQSWWTVVYVAILFVFIDLKTRREERWLAEKFPEYAEYRRRVRKLIPFVY